MNHHSKFCILSQSLSTTIVLFSILSTSVGYTAERMPAEEKPAAVAEETSAPEKVELDSIQEKYWARGDENELGVVQNRTHTKKGKVAFGLLGGVVATDPFLSVNSLGGTIGYHFSEYFSLHVVGWKHFVGPSAALTTFVEIVGATTNYNPPRFYLGAEAVGSLLYGKLSVLGLAIIYYDFHLIGGLGVTDTESGRYFTPSVGIGQQVYLSRFFSLRVDYRLLGYSERIIEKVVTRRIGEVVGNRLNWNNSITLGVTFFVGGANPSEASEAGKDK